MTSAATVLSPPLIGWVPCPECGIAPTWYVEMGDGSRERFCSSCNHEWRTP